METKIKRATRQYTCSKCGNPISVNTDYQDNSGQAKDGRWWHRRVCMNCLNKPTTNDSVFDRVLSKLNEGGAFPVAFNGIKSWVVGITYSITGKKYIQMCTWEDRKAFYETPESFTKYKDEDNNNI